MPKPQLSHRTMPALALSTLLVISTLPATSWLVRSQVQAQFGPMPGVESLCEIAGQSPGAQARRDAPILRAEAARHPNDFQAQVAAAIVAAPSGDGSESSRRVRALETLAHRFPGQPSLYAHILRFETQGPVVVNRKEETVLTGEALGTWGRASTLHRRLLRISTGTRPSGSAWPRTTLTFR
ncbi:MAG: hypothetical protein LC772_11110 [Chloroflexi bacterium]|nr:hypothetical protein [Chloroflexota bacterium]